MTQTLSANNVTLRDLSDRFGLQLVWSDQFFREWQDDLPELSAAEQQQLDRVKAGYFNLIEDPPLLEKTIQLAVVSPLLFLAGFYLPPFHMRAEPAVEIATEDEGTVIRGQLDVLVIKEQFWVLVIESKRASVSIEAGLGQLLAYMAATPDSEQPGYGLITNGSSFLFVKLVQDPHLKYATSRNFNLWNQGNELYQVLKILKRIGQL